MSRKIHEPSPETLELARQAVERNEATKKALDAMSPEDREKHIKAWAKGLAEQSVAIGERGVGCACCDPDVKAKLKEKEKSVPILPRRPIPKNAVILQCQSCQEVLYRGTKHPEYSMIVCPKCKASSKVNRPQYEKPAPPADVMPAEPIKFKA
jgi:phage FluMu protein Com